MKKKTKAKSGQTAQVSALPSYLPDTSRTRHPLTPQQTAVRKWICKNYGVISRVARFLNLTPQYVHRIAYGYEARSRELRVERALKQAGWPSQVPQ